MLLPPWVYPVMLGVAGVLRFAGSTPMMCALLFTLACGALYFADDLLKRKIVVDKGFIQFGFRTYKLSELVSMSLLYRRQEMVPSHMVLNFSEGERLKLKLSRLKAGDCEKLLKLISKESPDSSIDPTIRALSRVKQIAENPRTGGGSVRIFNYDTKPEVRELVQSFLNTLNQWARMGPLLTLILATPIWFYAISGTFVLGSMGRLTRDGMLDTIGAWMSAVGIGTAKLFTDSAGATMDFLTHNATLGFVLIISLLFIVLYLAQFCLRPNQLRFSRKGLEICQEIAAFTFTYINLEWDQLRAVKLHGNRLDMALDQGKLSIDLNAIAESDRTYLIESLEEFAPNCRVSSEVSETMLPKTQSYTELWLQSLTEAPERKSLEPLAVGAILCDGRYEVVGKLGSGGQGCAYLCNLLDAKSEKPVQQVVLKESIIPMFGRKSVRQQAIERFGAEARILSRFKDERIVSLLGHFIEDHRGYLVLEHIQGKTLRRLVEDEGPLSAEEVRGLAIQMADILACLHDEGIIHRDFTPDNLILSSSGRLKLIDFNVAQAADTGITGTVVGKHAYLPPEQIRGMPVLQSDIYAMGASLFYLLTGTDPEPISRSSPIAAGKDVPEDLDNLVRCCTELAVEERLQSVEQAKFKLSATINLTRGATVDA